MNVDISKSMTMIAAHLDAKFYLNDRFVSYEEVFSVTGLLPAIAKRARPSRLSARALKYLREQVLQARASRKHSFSKGATRNQH